MPARCMRCGRSSTVHSIASWRTDRLGWGLARLPVWVSTDPGGRKILLLCGGVAGTLPGVSAPPAEGARVAWRDVPRAVRGAIERVCGAPVAEAWTQPGGFSPGLAGRVRCVDGTRWFVKAASAGVNPDTPRLHRREAGVLASLDQLIAAGQLPVPQLRGTAERGPWFALILQDVAGRQPALPWQDGELGL